MAKYSMTNLFGLRKKVKKASSKHSQNEDKVMADFNHLALHAENSTEPDGYVVQKNSENGKPLVNVNAEQDETPTKHSRGHNLAVSEEAKNSPVLAVKLYQETKLSSKQIRERLSKEPEALSKFTLRYMEDNDPTWEFKKDDEKAFNAGLYSSSHNDSNGYLASKEAAVQRLKSMEDPFLTKKEIDKNIRVANDLMNASNPDTPDNKEARIKADKEAKDAIEKIIAKRNEVYQKTGVSAAPVSI